MYPLQESMPCMRRIQVHSQCEDPVILLQRKLGQDCIQFFKLAPDDRIIHRIGIRVVVIQHIQNRIGIVITVVGRLLRKKGFQFFR